MTEFLAVSRQQLRAEANAENGTLAPYHNILQSLGQIAFAQIMHGIAEGADAWQDQAIGARERTRVRRNYRLMTESLDRTRD